MLQHSSISRNTNEELKLRVRCPRPKEDDQNGEYHRAHSIQPPLQLRSTNTGQDTESVDEEIVPVVLPENPDLRVFVPKRPAVQE